MNDSMGKYVAAEVVKLMIKNRIPVKGARVLMLGITFKENCPDIRNTKAIDIYRELREYDINVDVYDPWAKPADVMHEYGISLTEVLSDDRSLSLPKWGAIILAVAHDEFKVINLKEYKDKGCVIYDVKGILEKQLVAGRL